MALRGHGTTVIDAPPDIRHQLNREGIDVIDDFFLTHAHYDHMGGLGEFEYFIRLYLMDVLPFHASDYAIAETLKEYAYMDDCFALDVMGPYDTREVDGLEIQALPLKHAPGTYGYLITTPQGRRTFYAPDTSDLKPEVIDILKGVDNLVMDSTFWENHGTARSHHDVRQTVHEGHRHTRCRSRLPHASRTAYERGGRERDRRDVPVRRAASTGVSSSPKMVCSSRCKLVPYALWITSIDFRPGRFSRASSR